MPGSSFTPWALNEDGYSTELYNKIDSDFMQKISMLLITLLTFLCSGTNAAHAAQARSLPIEVLRSQVRIANDRKVASELHFREESFQFTIASGKTLTAKLMIPVNTPKTTKLPVLSIFGGFQNAAKILGLVKPTIPMIVASFDYPFEAPRTFEFPSSLKYAPDAKRAVIDMLDGIAELHNVIKQRDDVDPARITVVGASFGAPFALAAAANDPTVSGVVLVHGFADIPNTVKHQLLRKWESKYGVFAHPVAWLLSHLGWLYLDGPAPEDSALHLTSRQRIFMISAEEDTFIPKSSSTKLWDAIEASSARSEQLVMPGDHLQPGSDQLIDQLTHTITTWMSKVELL